MRRYLIVHRAGEIYKLRFVEAEPDLWVASNLTGIFYPLEGWTAALAMNWLDERNFEYYWEDGDD